MGNFFIQFSSELICFITSSYFFNVYNNLLFGWIFIVLTIFSIPYYNEYKELWVPIIFYYLI